MNSYKPQNGYQVLPVCIFFKKFISVKLSSSAGIKQIYNLMLIKEASNVNIQKLWEENIGDTCTNTNYDDIYIHPLSSFIPHGNFRSSMIDEWEYDPPDEVCFCIANTVFSFRIIREKVLSTSCLLLYLIY